MCVEALYKAVYEQSPCADQPFSRSTTTGVDGAFTIEGLPTGFYVIVIGEDGVWTRIASASGMASRRVLVQPGEDVYLGEVIVGGE